MAARATLALKPGVWFRRGRLLIVSPDSLGTACPLSGRNSTYRLVQILEAGSDEAIEISFGQLKSRYDVPGYTKDTGNQLICQNTAKGASCIRDPIVDTGGV